MAGSTGAACLSSSLKCLAIWLLWIASLASANVQTLCSSQNTGSDFAVVTNHWQSNGRCQTTCQAAYAFAIVQSTSCWCSNYAPADTVPLSSCGVNCPGYPPEQCGDQPKGFFGYIQLKHPAGTIGAATSSSISTPSSTTAAAVTTVHAVSVSVQPAFHSDVTVEQTVTASPSIVVSIKSITPPTSSTPLTTPTATSTSTSSSIISSTSEVVESPAVAAKTSQTAFSSALLSPSSSAAPSWSPTPVVSVVTVTGQVKTLTITPTAPPAQTDLAQPSRKGGFFSDPGKVAGVFTIVALAVVALAGLVFWFCLRRRRNADNIAVGSVAGGDTPQRQPSKLSQMGLLGGSARRKPERAPPVIQTGGWGSSNTAEKSPTDTTPIDYRSSYPRIVDQRLDPVALWNPLHDNGSHVSIKSLQDNQDYSRRMLRVANPDQ